MIFFSVGLPGRFSEFCDALTLRLAERSLGDVSAGEFRTLDDIARAAIKADTPHLVAALRQPGRHRAAHGARTDNRDRRHAKDFPSRPSCA